MSAKKALTISIVIPAYNEENHLKACLDAIAAQTVAPNEVIVVDNNSSDRTAEIAKSYKFVQLLREPRQGIPFARDKGFNAVNSLLIGRIDADTVLPTDWVERVLAFYQNAEHQDQVLTGGAYFYNMRLGHIAGWWQGQIAFRINRLLLGHYIMFGSNAVVPVRLWEAIKSVVCHDINMHEDLDVAIHLHRKGFQINYHENLKVGIKMRRVFEDRDQLWENMLWWPQTLRHHKLGTWTIGWVGAALLYAASFSARLFKK